jgi:CSLREA domain-containing protein
MPQLARPKFIYFVVLLILLTLFIGPSAPTAVYALSLAVNSTADVVDANPGDGVCETATVGQCTLRAAIQEANALAGSDIITLPAGTYTLSLTGTDEDAAANKDLDITGPLTITGAGSASTIIQAGTDATNGIDRIFDVRAGATNVTISSVTMRYGHTVDGSGFGPGSAGAIFTRDTVVIQNSVLTNNHAGGSGGAIYSDTGTTTLINTEVSNNSSYWDGGAVQVSGNFNLINSTLSGNTSAVTGTSGGGGVFMNVGVPNLLTIRNSTIANNTNLAGAGGGVSSFFAGTVSMQNTIVTGNSGNECAVSGLTGSNNLVDDASCTGAASPVTNFDSTLTNNGGGSQTHALLPGSNAIGAGTGNCLDHTAIPLATDQRGFSRSVGFACDIGAFELGFVVNFLGDGSDNFPGNGLCEVSEGDCTLRAAIEEANASAGVDIITFDIGGSGPHTFSPATAFPTITEAVVIDGTTQPGASCTSWPPTLQIELDGTSAGSANGLDFAAFSADGSTVRGLVINRFSTNGINGAYTSNMTIECNFIGTNVTGTAALGNGSYGIELQQNSDNNVIGGPLDNQRNLISGNSGTNQITFPNFSNNTTSPSGNLIQNNYIGTDVTGMVALGGGSFSAIGLSGANTNQILDNLISGNTGYGIHISSSDTNRPSGNNIIQGNWIGVDSTGTGALGNGSVGVPNGISIQSSQNDVIGGVGPGEANIIAYNFGVGVSFLRFAGTESLSVALGGNGMYKGGGVGLEWCGYGWCVFVSVVGGSGARFGG